MKKTIARIAYVAMAFSLFLCPEKTAAQFWNTTGNAAIATDFLGTTNAMSLKIRTNSIQRMSVESTGNVGIGAAFTSTRLLHVRKGSSGITSNASANLVVESNTTNYLNILSPSTTENGILFGIGGGFGPSAQSGGLIYNSSTQRKGLLFRTGGNVNRMTLDSTGRLGIGTTAPLEKLDVVGNASISGDVYVPGNLRNNNTAGEQIVKISTTAGSDCGLQINRPGVGFFDFRMVNIGGNLRFSGSTDEFATVNNEWMNLNLSNGNLGIGASPGAEKLSVCGTVRCTELRVETGWCDYVFAKDYKLRSLDEVKQFIEENHHLPEIEAASVIETQGLKVGEMSAKMIKKIEELTLYVIQQNDRITALEKENTQLKNSHK